MITKVKKIKNKMGDINAIQELFEQMIGTRDADPIIIEKKYDNIKYHLKKIVESWDIFYKSEFAQKIHTEMGKGIDEIGVFVRESTELLSKDLLIETNKIKTEFIHGLQDELYELGSKYNAKDLNEAYREIKTSKLLQQIFVTLENIKSLLENDKQKSGKIFSCLDIPSDLSNSFISKTDLDAKILGFSCFDFNFLYNIYPELVPQFDKLVLITLYITYINALEVYKIFISPDIDVEKFVKTFGENLEGIRKVIPNCDKAFNTLKKSLKLLRKNFESYHKKYMTTGNPSVIFESFFADVQEKNKNDLSALVQFKKIVEYIKKNMPKDIRNNPAVNKLWFISDQIFEKY